jgi:hypothetical protein
MNEILRRMYLGILGILCSIWPVLGITLAPRDIATGTITTIPTYRWENITGTFGGSEATNEGPNFGMLLYNAVMTYSDSMGQIVYVIFFAIPFLMMWIVQSDMTMPAIIGMFFSLYVFIRLPEQYVVFGVGCFVIATAALTWSLYRRAY